MKNYIVNNFIDGTVEDMIPNKVQDFPGHFAQY
jgi:hypothetical protein